MKTAFELDVDAFDRLLPDLLPAQTGRFALIRSGSLVKTFESYEEALRVGYERFKLEPFLVNRIEPALVRAAPSGTCREACRV